MSVSLSVLPERGQPTGFTMSMRSLNKFSRMASASTWSFCKIVMQFWIVRWISPLECLDSISFTSATVLGVRSSLTSLFNKHHLVLLLKTIF